MGLSEKGNEALHQRVPALELKQLVSRAHEVKTADESLDYKGIIVMAFSLELEFLL
ncbi:MAG: hypothetical protein QNK29_04240 [Desulfobacterales bacterium]|nr:hypothetical protein [Desulfobacterales bacterium]MDX2511187.1 hypothetical protein [Desulfobacterales bacterium]